MNITKGNITTKQLGLHIKPNRHSYFIAEIKNFGVI